VQALGVTSVSLLAIQSPADLSVTFLIGLLKALIPALCMNVYIVGLNQIYDIEIDKVILKIHVCNTATAQFFLLLAVLWDHKNLENSTLTIMKK
jgi:hypothetical protein